LCFRHAQFDKFAVRILNLLRRTAKRSTWQIYHLLGADCKRSIFFLRDFEVFVAATSLVSVAGKLCLITVSLQLKLYYCETNFTDSYRQLVVSQNCNHFFRLIQKLFHVHMHSNKMGVAKKTYLQMPELFRIQINAQLQATNKPITGCPFWKNCHFIFRKWLRFGLYRNCDQTQVSS